MTDHIAKISNNFINGLAEKQLGFNKKRFFTKRDTIGMQTRVDLNLTTIPTAVDPDAFHSHHHYDVGIPIKTRFVRHPDVPIHEHNMKTMEDSYNLVANQVEQRKKHRGVSKQSPFNYQEAVTK